MVHVSVTLVTAAVDFLALVRVAGGLHFIVRDGMSTLRAAEAAREVCTEEERVAVREFFSAPRLDEARCPEATWGHVPPVMSREWLPTA